MRRIAVALLLSLALVVPTTALAHAAPAASGQATQGSVVAKHACTKTSSGRCIKGGQFCPNAKKGKRGWDAKGRVYICKNRHWRSL